MPFRDAHRHLEDRVPCQPTCAQVYISDCTRPRPIICWYSCIRPLKSVEMAYQEMQSQAPPGKQSPLKDEEADPLERNSMHLQHMKALDTVSYTLSFRSVLSWSSTIRTGKAGDGCRTHFTYPLVICRSISYPSQETGAPAGAQSFLTYTLSRHTCASLAPCCCRVSSF